MTSPQYGRINFSANVSCSVGTTSSKGNGCPSRDYIQRFDYTKVNNKQPSLPFLYTPKNMSYNMPDRTNTLVFPNLNTAGAMDPNGMTSPGVFTFNAWATSVCGKFQSKPVQLIARCPPIPTACGVVRYAQSRKMVTMSNGAYQVVQGQAVVLDGIASRAFQFFLPNMNNSNYNITSSQWSVQGTAGTDYMYLQQSQWQLTNPAACSNQTDTSCSCDAKSGNGFRCLQRYVKFETKGTFAATITVSDGCSYGATTISVQVQCSCAPSAMAVAVTTLNTNSVQGQNLNNHVAPSPVQWSLTAKGNDFDPNVRMYYDWMWTGWTPDYSQMVGTQPYSANAGLAPKTFSTQNVITSLGNANRKVSNDITDQSNYVYRVLYTVDPPGTQNISNWISKGNNQHRVQQWRFMKLAPQLKPATTSQQVIYNMNTTEYGVTTNVTTVPEYTGYPDNPDFNGFGNNNQTLNQNNGNTFLPTTQFKAYVSKRVSFFNNLQVVNTMTTTPQPSLVRDLVYCKVTIDQAQVSGASNGKPAYGNTQATLMMSSFGTCRGMWNFKLMVADGCGSPVYDSFNLTVGCNRRPRVSAGCSNTQTWAGTSFSQINLDGRYSSDPDNFGDPFYNLTLPKSMEKSALTYAWVMMSGLGYDMNNANKTCPFDPFAACAQQYCASGQYNSIMYNSVDLTKGTATATVVSGAVTFQPSLQGGAYVSQAYNGYPMAYQYNISSPKYKGSQGAGYNVSLGAPSAPTRPEQLVPLFPNFKAGCAPTVFPMFTPANGATQANINIYKVINPQHQGQSAYLSGIKREGTLVARLYAFDGCSVSYADVSVMTKCPSLTFNQAVPNLGLKSDYMLYWDSSSSSSALTISVPNDVTVTYKGLPSVSVTVSMTIVPPANSGLSNVTKVAPPSQGPGSNRIAKTSTLTFNFGSALSTSQLQPSDKMRGTYSVFLSVSDGCKRSDSSYSDEVMANAGQAVATFNVKCPYSPILNTVDLLNSTTLTYNQTVTSSNPPALPEQYVLVQGKVLNCSSCTSGNAITGSQGNIWVKTQVYFTYSANTVSNPGSLSYPNAPFSFSDQDLASSASYVFKLYSANRNIQVAQSSPTVPILSGQAGYATFTAGTASGKSNMAMPNSGGYKVMVSAYPKQGPCAMTSSTKYFSLSCLSINSPVLVDATVASNPVVNSNPVLTLAPFVLTSLNNQGQYNGGGSPRYAQQASTIQGAFKKIGMSAQKWPWFVCKGGSTCSTGNSAGSNVWYSVSYMQTKTTQLNQNVDQNPLGLSPYSAFYLTSTQKINPLGFSADPTVFVPTFPGQWRVSAQGISSCSQGSTAPAANSQLTTNIDISAYCSDWTMPNATLDVRFDFSTRAPSSPTLQPGFTTCPAVSSVPSGPNRRLMAETGQGTVPESCGLSCGDTQKIQTQVKMFWDSFDVQPGYSNSGNSDVRNFNDMGNIAALNGKNFPYGVLVSGSQKNFVGRFPTLKMTVPEASFFTSSSRNNATHPNIRFISWYSWSSIPSAGSCSVPGGGALNGCSTAFLSNSNFGMVTAGNSVANFNLNQLNVKTVTGSVGTVRYQVFVWNGPPGLSCYDYRTVVVCGVCNNLSLGTLSVTPGSTSVWDGTKFPSIGLSSAVTYQQNTAVQGAGTIAGSLYSLVYSWQVTQSPLGSMLAISGGNMYTQQIPAGFTNGIPYWKRATSIKEVNTTDFMSGSVPFSTVTTQQNFTTFFQNIQTRVSLTNHHYQNPVTCLQPDVQGQYAVSLMATDGCTSDSKQTTVTAQCPPLPSFTFKTTSASGATAQPSGNSWSIAVDGTQFDRITVRATKGSDASNNAYTYYWRVQALTSNESIPVMNGEGTVVSFFAQQLPQWASSNTQMYSVKMVATSNCPDSMGMRMQKSYTMMLSVTCNTPGLASTQLLQYMDGSPVRARVFSRATNTTLTKWWGGNSTAFIPFTNQTVSLSCNLDQNGGPSPYCGAYGSSSKGVPTVLFLSSAFRFYDYAFEVDGAYSSKCAVKSTFWQLSALQCALPYKPVATALPYTPAMCKPTITNMWTLVATPCTNCHNGTLDRCDTIAGYSEGFKKYEIPAPFSQSTFKCIYNSGGRLYGQHVPYINNLQQNCITSGVGLEGPTTNSNSSLQFTPKFPGVYKLNYTVSDGCQPPQTTTITINARCVTKMTTPTFISKQISVGYYCNGQRSTSAVQAPGSFETVHLDKAFIQKFSVSQNSDAWMPSQPNGCVLPQNTPLTCTTAEAKANGLTVYGISSGQSNMKGCCKCLFGMSIIDATATKSLIATRAIENAVHRQERQVAVLAEEVSQSSVSNSVSPVTVVGPLAVLLVASVVANMALVSRRRRDSLPM